MTLIPSGLLRRSLRSRGLHSCWPRGRSSLPFFGFPPPAHGSGDSSSPDWCCSSRSSTEPRWSSSLRLASSRPTSTSASSNTSQEPVSTRRRLTTDFPGSVHSGWGRPSRGPLDPRRSSVPSACSRGCSTWRSCCRSIPSSRSSSPTSGLERRHSSCLSSGTGSHRTTYRPRRSPISWR